MSLRALLLIGIIIPSVPICLFSPFYGIVLWTIVAFASPQWLAWGAAYMLPIAEMIAVPTLVGVLLRKSSLHRLMCREVVFMVLLWIWFTFTTLVSTHTPIFMPHMAATLAKWEFVTKVMVMSIVTVAIVDSFNRLRILTMVTASCFAFYVVKALPAIIMAGGTFRLYGPPKSMVEDNNDLGLALNMTLPLLFFIAHSETGRKLKVIFWFLFAVTIPGIFMTYSRGALVGLVAVIGMMLLRLKQRILLIPVVFMAAIVAILFVPDAWKERMDFTNEDAVMDESARSRINSWTFSWRLAQQYPLTGGGFETFTRDLYPRFAPNGRDVHGPHSVYFGVLAEHGFVGFFLYMGLVGSCFLRTWRISRLAHRYGDTVAGSYAYMFSFSLIGFLSCGAFLGRAYFDYYFAIVACVAILNQTCSESWGEGHLVVPGSDYQEDEETPASELTAQPGVS